MSCDPDRLVSFLAGELPENERAACDAHLLQCEDCWSVVLADRVGRAAARRLRAAPPDALAERITHAVRTARQAGSGRGWRRWRGRARLAAAACALTVASAAGGWLLGARHAPADPAAVTAVAALAPQAADDPGTAPSALHLVAGGQQISVRFARADGVEVAIASSDAMFAAPADARRLAAGRMAWTATRGPVALYCLNTDRPSVLLAAAVPAERLPTLARDLGLAH